MIKFILRIFDGLGWLLDRLGVDRDTFRAILEIKLTQDQRRSIKGIQAESSKKKDKAFLMSLATMAFFGGFMGLLLLMTKSPLTGLTMVNSFIMVMMGLMLLGDFTNVLVDTTDNTVLLPRPVSDRTLFAVRTAHVISYLGALSLALSMGTLVTGTIVYHPLFALVYLPSLILFMVLVVFAVFLFYLFAMKKVDLEKFRDIILYFQIVMTVFIFGAYQIVPRLVEASTLENLTIERSWWIYLCPPTWMAAPTELLMGNFRTPVIVLTVLAVAAPVVCMVFVVRVLAPGFTQALAVMEGGGTRREARRPEGVGRSFLARAWSRLLTRGPEERATFEFIWSLASRDRAFKLGTYPSAIFVIIIMAIFFYSEIEKEGSTLADLAKTQRHLLGLYFACYAVPIALLHLRYSDQHQAAWLYAALPVRRPGILLSASLKVVLARFALPLFIVVSILVLAFWGPRVFPDVALAGGFFLVYSLVVGWLFSPVYPFSQARSASDTSQGFGIVLFMITLAGVGFGHYLLRDVPYAVPVLALVLFAAAIIGFRMYGRVSWKKVQHRLVQD